MDMKIPKVTLNSVLKMVVTLLVTLSALATSYIALIEPRIVVLIDERIDSQKAHNVANGNMKLSEKLSTLLNVEPDLVANEVSQMYFWYKQRVVMDGKLNDFVNFWDEWEYVGVLKNKITGKFRYFPGVGYENHYRVYMYNDLSTYAHEGNVVIYQ